MINPKTFGLLVLCFLMLQFSNISAQENKKNTSTRPKQNSTNIKSTVVATVGKEKITYEEIEKAYSKNLAKKNTPFHLLPKDSLLDFVNLYLRYRLKVNDAFLRGLDKDPNVVEEIKQNRRLLAETFYFEKKLVEPNVERMLKYREFDAQVSYIFLQFPSDNPDTLPTYNRALKLIELLKKGEDFGKLAKDSSQDRETAERGGLILNFITGGKVQRPIEDAIFSLKVGEYTEQPIRTKFGYFILKLNKLVPRTKVKGKHILISVGPNRDTTSAFRKADSLLNLIRIGADFSRLAEENSDDPASAMRGGDLGGWYSRSSGLETSGRFFTTAFEEALYSLKDNEISKPILTEYGVHIIKRDSTGFFNRDEDREELKRLYKRLYYESDKKEFIEKLQRSYGFSIETTTLKKFLSLVDTTKTAMDTNFLKTEFPSELQKSVLYKLQDRNFSLESFINTLKTKQEYKSTSLNTAGITNAISKLVYPIVIDEATKNLEEENQEFASMIREFRDGILLFRVEALEVWDKLKFDSTLAYQYWEKNKSKYKTHPSYELYEIYVLSDSLAQAIYNRIKNNEDFEELAGQFTQRANLREKKGFWGKVTTRESKLAQKLFEMNAQAGQIYGPFQFDDGYSIVKVSNYEAPREKTFNEAIPDFATDVQEIIQKNLLERWLAKAQKQIPIKINHKQLDLVVDTLKKTSTK
ncbi:MAG: peptidylprolyl isomerase [Ignavibacteria bacterium]|nr:peptidylprolyl isomerase [Ignavibacteria bacterium]